MASHTDLRFRLLNQFDLLVMFGAVVTLFVALGTEPWWTLNGTTTANLLSIQVSPFYVHIDAIGLPATVALAAPLGTLTRTFLLLGFLSLFAAGIRPTAWWRNLAVTFGLAALAELYFSFFMMYYWAETAFVNAYGVPPPLYGTTSLQANVIGLDFSYYASPLVTAAYGIPYYLGFVSLGLILGRTFIQMLRERALQALSSLLPDGAIHDVYLTPPYGEVLFSSRNKQFNPMQRDPETLNDGELLISFQKLYETVEPGGSMSVILPGWATSLADRLEKLMPQTGFTIEKIGMINRTLGAPENQLLFRKTSTEPALETVSTPVLEPVSQVEQAPPQQVIETLEKTEQDLSASSPVTTEPPSPLEPPRVLEIVEPPAWTALKMTRLERSILKVAIKTITERRQPVPYRELLNQVYMDLVDHKIEFDSARQIETTLLNHNGREVVMIEEVESNGNRTIKKWWLGDQRMNPESRHRFPGLARVKKVKPGLSSIKKALKRSRAPRYTSSQESDDETSADSYS